MPRRIMNELVLFWAVPSLLDLLKWTRDMRQKAGVTYLLPVTLKPKYLVLINSFFGLKIPRDLPPLAALIGPILADEYPPLREHYLSFLSKHRSIIYMLLALMSFSSATMSSATMPPRSYMEYLQRLRKVS